MTEAIPCKYGSARSFSEGLAAVELDGKWGYIDQTGKEVIPCKYDDAWNFTEGLVAVCDESWKYGFINKEGEEVIPCKYDSVGEFSGGLAVIYLDGKYGYIDQTGTEVIPCKYDDALYFSEGMAAVELDGKWGFLAISQSPTTLTANPTNDALKVDGVAKVPSAYKIDGANYFQLRDVAMLLNGTKGQFSVDYDAEKKAVVIVTGQPYMPLGTELAGAASQSQVAIVGNNDIYINGVKVDLPVYKIDGANYFKIRDLGENLGFNVGWTLEQGMFIQSDKPYDPND